MIIDENAKQRARKETGKDIILGIIPIKFFLRSRPAAKQLLLASIEPDKNKSSSL